MAPSQASPLGSCCFWLVWLCCLLLSLPPSSSPLISTFVSFLPLLLHFPLCRVCDPHTYRRLCLPSRKDPVLKGQRWRWPVIAVTLPCWGCCQVAKRGLAAESLFGDLCKLGRVGLPLLGSFYFGRAPLWQTRAGVLSAKNSEKQNNPQLTLHVWVSTQSKPGSQTMCSALFLHRHVLIFVELCFCCRSSTETGI